MQNLNGALTQGHITTVGEANESNFILDCRSVVCLRFPLWASGSPESNETQSYHRVKAINPALMWPVFVSDTGADSAHGQLHEPLEPQPPVCLTPAPRPLGRRQQAFPRNELHHQGPHTTVNCARTAKSVQLQGGFMTTVTFSPRRVACLGFTFLQNRY